MNEKRMLVGRRWAVVAMEKETEEEETEKVENRTKDVKRVWGEQAGGKIRPLSAERTSRPLDIICVLSRQ